MDTAKEAKLREVGYSIAACGLCQHAAIDPGSEWGTCGLHTYIHGKHTGPERHVSINRHGVCPMFTPDASTAAVLQGFVQFLR